MPYLYIYMYPSHRLAADQSSAEAPIEVLEAMRIESTELPRVGVMATVASARSFNNNVPPFDHTFDDRGVQFVQDQLPLDTEITDFHLIQGVRGTAGLDVSTDP